jgi:hypothetical protein
MPSKEIHRKVVVRGAEKIEGKSKEREEEEEEQEREQEE